jgi:hypothetical protein
MPDLDEDATHDALERIASDGSDMSRPLDMDFFVAVPDAGSGSVIAARVAQLGFATNVERDAETGDWTCYCTKRLVPTLEAVVAIERQLDALAREVGGHADGFGTYGNAEEAAAKN